MQSVPIVQFLKTTDGGFGWKKLKTPFDTTLSDVFARDEKNIVVVGARSTVFSSNNGGKTWKKNQTELKQHFRGLTFIGDDLDTGWIVGTNGSIIKTNDGGENLERSIN